MVPRAAGGRDRKQEQQTLIWTPVQRKPDLEGRQMMGTPGTLRDLVVGTLLWTLW